MKQTLSFLAGVILTLSVAGQENSSQEVSSGRITYEEKIKLEIRLEGDAAGMAAMLPKERRSVKLLTFNNTATLFEAGPDVDDEMATGQGEGTVKIRMVGAGENKTFTDLKSKKVTEQRDFMNRIFLVEKKMPEDPWKMTGNQKAILGYPCMEAIKQDTAGNKTVAWFTPSINIGSGPSGLCNLPGMILEADFNDGSRTYIAKSVEPVNAASLKLQRPKDGKSVTEEEYQAIVDEKMKEMGVEPGQSRTNSIQITISR